VLEGIDKSEKANGGRQAGERQRGHDRPRRIAVLETGLVPDELAGRYDDYPTMFASMMEGLVPGADYRPVSVVRHAPLPLLDEIDACVIMGSRHGVYDDFDWIARLRAFVRDAAEAERPMVGICFGHQIMAEALGGRAGKAEAGWGVGRQTYRVRQQADWMTPPARELAVLAAHQDQVTAVPPSAQVLGGNDFCPFGILAYEAPAISFQFHPEFAAGYAADVIEARRGAVIPEPVAKAAMRSLEKPVDHDIVARWIARFLNDNLAMAGDGGGDGKKKSLPA
jgi:GMP synthase-like glutamine amidotransferase